jgi:hypothetical protein
MGQSLHYALAITDYDGVGERYMHRTTAMCTEE